MEGWIVELWKGRLIVIFAGGNVFATKIIQWVTCRTVNLTYNLTKYHENDAKVPIQ